jgi:phospho-N-acetylmuramoyl-pentapeptide-transferase
VRLILTAAGISLLAALFGTPLLIRTLRKYGYAQAIRDSTQDVIYPDHGGKRGTPSMGGLVIIAAVLVGYTVAHLVTTTQPTASGVLLLFLMTALGLVGFLDDYIKIFKQRSTGLRARTKLIGQALAAVSFALLALRFPNNRGITPASEAVSVVRDTPLVLGSVLMVIWIYFLITGMSNAVNLADGLDGLAAGACVATFAAYVLIGVWQFGQRCSAGLAPKCYEVRDPIDLAIVAAALMGACLGFLWWNASPARIFMGDTGSLSLGGAVAGLAILTRTQLLVALIGGLFVLITLSVILQVGSFKLTGKRIFRMAPLQHHFEMAGWHEVTIVIRFWIIAIFFVGAGLAAFYGEWIAGGAL